MLIKLAKSHPLKDYAKNHEIFVYDNQCPSKKCFSIHNYSCRLSNGRIVNDFRCRMREMNGCQDEK